MTQAKGYFPDHPFVLTDGRTAWYKKGAKWDLKCENKHIVPKRDIRGWVDDEDGVDYKGHKRRFYCVPCMLNLGAPEVPRW